MPTATRLRYSITDVEELQMKTRAHPSKLDAVRYFADHYPHLSPRFVSRHLDRLMSMDAIQLIEALGYPDPTGEQATRNAMRAAA